jgi:hypothetical protein
VTHVEPGRNPAVGTGPAQGPGAGQVNGFLAAFGRKPLPNIPPVSMKAARDAFWDGDWDEVEDTYRDPRTTREAKEQIRQMMLGEDAGIAALAADPDLADIYLSAADPAFLRDSDLFLSLGRKKDDVVASTLLALASKKPADAANLDRDTQRDPALFGLLAEEIDLNAWNDTGKAIGAPKRGLGPRVCAALWFKGGYDEICKLIELGVDTTVPAQAETRGGLGVYSDFVMPLQHILQKHLRDIEKLGSNEAQAWDDARKAEVQGARKVFEALDRAGAAATLTRWSDVKNSEMVAEFQKEPGTIWGFEEVRLPYVQAAHETPQGAQPVRMMELWDAVIQTLSERNYAKLLDDPDSEIPRIVDLGAQTVGREIDKKDKYAEVRGEKDTYLARFRHDATAFLTEFAAQIPKGSFARVSEDTKGQPRPQSDSRPDWSPLAVSDVAGIHNDKFMSSFACKAGLWWAKNEGKPVYYCLDGINMDDVTDYKKVKNKAIEEFLAEGGATTSTKPHREVVTMKEMREILRNWDDLKDTVKFVDKGKVLKDQELTDAVDGWQKKMAASNAEAGRTPAPPKASFAKELAAIDPNLPERLEQIARLQMDPAESDKDARDIVRKAGYLLKIANTRPDYVLKYLMSKCGVLADYGLIPAGLADAAAALAKLASLDPPAQKSATDKAAADLVAQLKLCPAQFRQPLAEALVRYPLVQQAKKSKKQLKKM